MIIIRYMKKKKECKQIRDLKNFRYPLNEKEYNLVPDNAINFPRLISIFKKKDTPLS